MRLILILALFPGQDDPLKELRAVYDTWQAAKEQYIKGFEEARKAGKVGKGVLPEDVQKLRDAADALRDRVLAVKRDGLPAAAFDLLGAAYEDARDYKTACDCLEQFVKSLRPEADNYRPVLYRLSLAALNSKNAERGARWMRALIDAEKETPPAKRVGDFVRLTLYPRQLVELEKFEELLAFAGELDKEGEDVESRRGAVLARFLASMGLKKLDAAEAVLDGLLAKPESGMRTWAVQGKIAFLASRGRHAEVEKLIADTLAVELGNDAPPMETSARRYLAAAGAYIGKPAPEVVVDRWVGAEKDPGAKPLEAWKGKVVLLDFWQPW